MAEGSGSDQPSSEGWSTYLKSFKSKFFRSADQEQTLTLQQRGSHSDGEQFQLWNEMENRLQAKVQQTENMKNEISQLGEQNTQLQTELEKIRQKYSDELGCLKEENDALKASQQENTVELERIRAENGKLKEECKRVLAKAGETTDISANLPEVESLRRELADKDKIIHDLQEQMMNNSSISDNDGLNTTLRAREPQPIGQPEGAGLQARYENKKQQLKECRKDVEILKLENTRLVTRNEILNENMSKNRMHSEKDLTVLGDAGDQRDYSSKENMLVVNKDALGELGNIMRSTSAPGSQNSVPRIRPMRALSEPPLSANYSLSRFGNEDPQPPESQDTQSMLSDPDLSGDLASPLQGPLSMPATPRAPPRPQPRRLVPRMAAAVESETEAVNSTLPNQAGVQMVSSVQSAGLLVPPSEVDLNLADDPENTDEERSPSVHSNHQ